MPRQRIKPTLQDFVLFLEASECPQIEGPARGRVTFLCQQKEIVEFFAECLKKVEPTRKVPANLAFEAGQVFFDLDGSVEEVRLTGQYSRRSSRRGQWETAEWLTQVKPNVRYTDTVVNSEEVISQGKLALNLLDERRLNISVLKITENLQSPLLNEKEPTQYASTEQILVSFRVKPRSKRDIFPDAVTIGTTLEVPASPHYALLHKSIAYISHPKTWSTETDNGFFKYYDLRGRAFDARVFFNPPAANQEELEQQFNTVRPDLVADIVDIFHTHWMFNGRPRLVEITLADILNYRKQAVTALTMRNHCNAVSNALALRMNVGRQGSRGHKVIHLTEAVVAESVGDQLLSSLKVECPRTHTIIPFEHTPGSGIKRLNTKQQAHAIHFVYGVHVLFRQQLPPTMYTADASGDGLTFYNPESGAQFRRELLSWDDLKQCNSKRLLRYLRAEWRRNASAYRHGRRYRTWDAHFADAGIIIPSGKAQQRRFVKDLVTQVDMLCNQRFLVGEPHLKSLCYHKDDRQKFVPVVQLPLSDFLRLRVTLKPPSEFLESILKHYPKAKR